MCQGATPEVAVCTPITVLLLLLLVDHRITIIALNSAVVDQSMRKRSEVKGFVRAAGKKRVIQLWTPVLGVPARPHRALFKAIDISLTRLILDHFLVPLELSLYLALSLFIVNLHKPHCSWICCINHVTLPVEEH